MSRPSVHNAGPNNLVFRYTQTVRSFCGRFFYAAARRADFQIRNLFSIFFALFMRAIFIFFSLTLLTVGMSCNETTGDRFHFEWLAGSWEMATDEGMITEDWTLNNDTLLTGSSAIVKNDSVQPFETIVLTVTNKKASYIVTSADSTAGNRTVAFTITQHNKNSFTAENNGHDFPKRITYQLIRADSIHAWIDGGEQEPTKRVDFYYKRKSK